MILTEWVIIEYAILIGFLYLLYLLVIKTEGQAQNKSTICGKSATNKN